LVVTVGFLELGASEFFVDSALAQTRDFTQNLGDVGIHRLVGSGALGTNPIPLLVLIALDSVLSPRIFVFLPWAENFATRRGQDDQDQESKMR
jgi:hypothetical protein